MARLYIIPCYIKIYTGEPDHLINRVVFWAIVAIILIPLLLVAYALIRSVL